MRVRISSHWTYMSSVYFDNAKSFSKVFVLIYIPSCQQHMKVLSFHIITNIWYLKAINFYSNVITCKMVLHFDFSLYFHIANIFEHIFNCFNYGSDFPFCQCNLSLVCFIIFVSYFLFVFFIPHSEFPSFIIFMCWNNFS